MGRDFAADVDKDPTLGGIVGDGTAKIRNLSCKTTRLSHSDPGGLRDDEPCIVDRVDLSLDIEMGSGQWQQARARLRQTLYQGAHRELESFDMGPPGDTGSTKMDKNSEILPAKGFPKESLAGGWDAASKMRQWMISRVFAQCLDKGAGLGSRDPSGAIQSVDIPEVQTLPLCDPRQCNHLPWAAAMALSTGCFQSLGGSEREEKLRMAQALASLPEEALGLAYRGADRLEGWQIAGLIQRGMPSRWNEIVVEWSDDDDGERGERELFAPAGLMHEAVSLNSDFEFASPWRLIALSEIVDPDELDSQGRTARELVRQQLANEYGGYYWPSADDIEALRGAEAFFESQALRISLRDKASPEPSQPAPRL